MATRKKSKSARKNSASKSAKAPPRPRGAAPKLKGLPRGKAFEPGNPWRIKPGEVRNPTGRPQLVSDAYRQWLAYEDEDGITNAARIAMAQGTRAIVSMDTQAAKEIRLATEGTRVTTWQDDVVKLLRKKKLTRAEVEEELGVELAEELTTAAGLSGGEGGEAEEEGGAEAAGSGGQA